MSSAPCQCSAEGRSAIIDAAAKLGACAAGFADIAPVDSSHRDLYARWLASGHNGGMEYAERYGDVRDNPALLLEGANSILCLAFAYRDSSTRRHPLFADYALGLDYHDVLRKRLAPLAALMSETVEGSQTRICIDTAPLRERYWAMRAGLGFIGRNNTLIIPGIGSRVFLAEILWTASVEASPECAKKNCIGCEKCIEACPYGALSADGGMDCRRCLSYLTIEHRGDLPPDIDLKGRIYGCDICQDVCPHNSGCKDAAVIDEFRENEALRSLDLDAIAGMEQDEFSKIFKGSAIKRAKLAGLRRNALRALDKD